MRKGLLLAMVLCIGAAIGCSRVYDVQFDYDQETDFSQLKSYGWLPTPEGVGIDDITIARIQKAVNIELAARGLILDAQNPDFRIAEHIGSEEKVQINTWGYSYGSYKGYWGGYWGHGGVSEYRYEEGTLILDFVDAATNRLIWRGAAKAEIDRMNTPEKKDALVAEAVQKILKNYPPEIEK